MSVWLWTLLGILAFVLLVVISFLLSHAECKIVIQKSGRHERIWIGIRMWYGLFRWRYEVRSVQFKGVKHVDLGVKKKQRLSPVNQGKAKLKMNVDLSVLLDMVDLLNWLKVVKVDTFIWDTEIGLDETPLTAMATGAVWGSVAYGTGLLTQYLSFHTMPRLQVEPNFQELCFSTRMVCISRVRIAKATAAVVALIFRLQDFKGGHKVWQNIQSKG
ncbi:DUF2953 domain-containing protein [Paenibacillus aquistagni]|uniref:DUF2953 domain-containing protein n=1 Tax=Paenibacillus aquistagni TaxID=1852522 RepID=UPI001483882B|nr:DUF2953 domain-containing protein [Paenibacillus aquistagni]